MDCWFTKEYLHWRFWIRKHDSKGQMFPDVIVGWIILGYLLKHFRILFFFLFFIFLKKHVDKDSLNILSCEKHVTWPICVVKTTLTKYVLIVNIRMNYIPVNCGHALSIKRHQLSLRSVKLKCANTQTLVFM